jgi:hypothetical protein
MMRTKFVTEAETANSCSKTAARAVMSCKTMIQPPNRGIALLLLLKCRPKIVLVMKMALKIAGVPKSGRKIGPKGPEGDKMVQKRGY